MIKAFTYGLKKGVQHWRTALIGYVFQLLLAITLGMQIYQVFEAAIGSSLELNKLMDGYNDAVISDFLNIHGASLFPLLGQLRYVVLVFLIFSIFINAGLLNALVKNVPGWNSFWEGGKTYFFRFIPVTLFFVILAASWSAVSIVPYIGYMQPSIEDFDSEKTTVFLFFVVLFIWLLGIIYLFNSSVITRIKIIKENSKVWQGIKTGLRISLRRFIPLTTVFILFVLLQLILIVVYWLAEGSSGMVSPLLIFSFFIFQQLMVLMRWMFRVAMYGGVEKLSD
ncbi:MAG: hypothetical protein AAFZ15_08275 [Bacteroidota bacterium]